MNSPDVFVRVVDDRWIYTYFSKPEPTGWEIHYMIVGQWLGDSLHDRGRCAMRTQPSGDLDLVFGREFSILHANCLLLLLLLLGNYTNYPQRKEYSSAELF